MKILIYGTGVIGSYIAHVLCRNGHEVSILARNERKKVLEKEGLIIRHSLQLHTTVDHPQVVEKIEEGTHYDAIFAVMQYQQMWKILDDLAQADTPLLVLVGNNMEAEKMEEYIMKHSEKQKTVLFGFSGTAGRKDGKRVLCERFGAAHLSCGFSHSEVDERTKAMLTRMLTGKYQPIYINDMDAWYKYHLAFILPVAYCCYTYDCNLKKMKKQDRVLCIDAVYEVYVQLEALGYPFPSESEILYFKKGTKERKGMERKLAIMAKTFMGKLAASDHCKAAVSEMEEMEASFLNLLGEDARKEMPCFEELRRKKPDWESLHKQWI